MAATWCSDFSMRTFSAIIEAFGGPSEFGSAIGIPDSHARTMKARDSIPAKRWTAVAEAAMAREIDGVTVEAMAQIEASKHQEPARVA